MWLLFTAGHLIGLVGYSLILRRSLLNNVDKYLLATLMQTGIALPIIVFSIFKRPDFSVIDAEGFLIIGVIVFAVIFYHYTTVSALKHLEVSVYSVLFNLRIVFSTVSGILFLGEPIVWLRILGGLLIFAAIFIVKQQGKKELTAQGIRWGVLSALSVVLLQSFERPFILHYGWLQYSILAFVLTTVLMWALLLIRNRELKLSDIANKEVFWLMFFRALSAYGGTLMFAAGLYLSVTSYLSSLSVILIVIFGVLLLNERDYLGRKIAATVVAVAGLTAILFAHLL